MYEFKFLDSMYERWTQLGEHELSAFIGAVRELYGPEQARLSAEDWLDRLQDIESPPQSVEEWREITIAAAARLVSRVNISAASANLAHHNSN